MKTQKIWALGVVCLLPFGAQVCLSPSTMTDVGSAPPRWAAASKNHHRDKVPQRPRPGDTIREVAIGSLAPDWRLKAVDGEEVALSKLRGKVVVLDFWSSWCGPCRKLEPLFDRLAVEYRSKPVKFFTMSVWPDQDFIPQDYVKDRKLATTFLIGDDAVARNYGIWGVPTYCVIDAEGKMAFFHTLLVVDPEALGNRLREAIERALPKEQDARSFLY